MLFQKSSHSKYSHSEYSHSKYRCSPREQAFKPPHDYIRLPPPSNRLAASIITHGGRFREHAFDRLKLERKRKAWRKGRPDEPLPRELLEDSQGAVLHGHTYCFLTMAYLLCLYLLCMYLLWTYLLWIYLLWAYLVWEYLLWAYYYGHTYCGHN